MSLPEKDLETIAVSFYGTDQNSNPAYEDRLVENFLAYLTIFIDAQTVAWCISPISKPTADLDNGRLFGKPYWNFAYYDATVFVTKQGYMACSIAVVQGGDVVSVPESRRFLF